MGKVFSATTLANHDFKVWDITPKWIDIIGQPETNFNMMVYGASGSGKTTFVLKLLNQLLPFGKVYYNSIEQGWSKSLKDNMSRSNLAENAEIHKLMFGDRDNLDEMRKRLKTNRARFVVVDSIQYLHLTKNQWEGLKADFRKKAFILISHEKNRKPKGIPAQDILYDVDIKMRIQNGITDCSSRYGNTKSYDIFNDVFVTENPQKEAVTQFLLNFSKTN